jgi:hypothetical protein
MSQTIDPLDINERFELQAAIFYRMTGHMAPGKSRPISCSDEITDEERSGLWLHWQVENENFIQAMFRAIEHLYED